MFAEVFDRDRHFISKHENERVFVFEVDELVKMDTFTLAATSRTITTTAVVFGIKL